MLQKGPEYLDSVFAHPSRNEYDYVQTVAIGPNSNYLALLLCSEVRTYDDFRRESILVVLKINHQDLSLSRMGSHAIDRKVILDKRSLFSFQYVGDHLIFFGIFKACPEDDSSEIMVSCEDSRVFLFDYDVRSESLREMKEKNQRIDLGEYPLTEISRVGNSFYLFLFSRKLCRLKLKFNK